jgi:hypothetical protein
MCDRTSSDKTMSTAVPTCQKVKEQTYKYTGFGHFERNKCETKIKKQKDSNRQMTQIMKR